MSRWFSTIRGQVFSVALLPLAFLLAILLLVGVLRFQTNQATGAVRRADDAIAQSERVVAGLSAMQSHITRYFTSRNPADLQAAQRESAAVPARTARLRGLVADSEIDEKHAVVLSKVAGEINSIERQYLEAAKHNDRRAAMAVLGSPRGRAAVAAWQQQAAALTQEETVLRKTRWARLQRISLVFDWAFGVGAVLCILLTLLAAQALGGDIARRLEQIRRKTRRFASSGHLGAPSDGTDEIADLDRSYHEMAQTVRQREAQLRKYRLLAQHARDIILFIRRSDGRIIEANAAAAAAYGYSIDELEQLNARELRAPETLERFDAELDRAAENPLIYQTVHRRKDGTLFPVEVAGQTVEIDGERLMVSIVRDITERRLAQQEVQYALKQAIQASRSKSEFLATMSHEIRTPLNAVIGMTELLLQSNLSDDQRHCAAVAHDSGEALLHLINDILDFSKIEAQRVDLEFIEFQLVSLVEGVANLFATQAARNRVALMTYVNPKIPQVLVGDPGRLRQVLTNLTGNAVKFTQDGSVVLSADYERSDEQTVTVTFSVRDTGIGIDSAALEALFEPFRQADGSTTRRYGGTGLGLSISKGLVELMGGTISAESEPGAGSTFAFTVGFKTAGKERPELPNLCRMRALVVDDDAIALEVFRRYLESWRMRCDATADPLQACKMVEDAGATADPYDVILLDLAMPAMDGFELARRLQSTADLSHTRLIMVTAYDEPERGRAATEAGFSGYLTKPVRQSQLYDCIVNVSSAAQAAHRFPSAERHAAQRILVAEDNAINREVALRQLAKLGYAAQAVADGREAVDAAVSGRFDVVLMDCQMPNMDGFEATRAIRKGEARSGKRVRIIAMTANALAEDRQACIDAGMDDYLAKPVTLDALRRALNLTSAPQALDSDRLNELFEGDHESMSEFLASTLPALLRLITRLEETATAAERATVAHELKGAAANVGAAEIARIAAQVEESARRGEAGDAAALFAHLHQAYGRALADARSLEVDHERPDD